jgi:hypothetical protein
MTSFRLPSGVRRLAHGRKLVVPLAAFAAGTVIAPVAAYAATGSFSSSNSTSAVTATNTGGGYALDATGTTATSIRSTTQGTGTGSAMWLRQYATGDGSNALYAKSYAAAGTHYGVQGVTSSLGAGVYGQGANDTGVAGEGTVGVVGSGSAYGVVSLGDTLTMGGNAYDNGGVSGVCHVDSGASGASCTFQISFIDPTAKPIVVVTPQGDPGGSYWVTDATATGFQLNLSNGAPGALDFGFHVIGLYPPQAAKAKVPGSAAKQPQLRRSHH